MSEKMEQSIADTDRELILPLDPEVRAMQNVARALEPLDLAARNRVLKWAVARLVNAPSRQEIETRLTGECA